eukprot:gene6173-10180_t
MIKLSELVDLTHDLFSKGYTVYATSISVHSDGSNVFSILPTGDIILSLDKDTYQSFGINGTKSKFSHQHLIEINFSKLTKEKPLYQKLMKGLEKTLPVSCLISAYDGDNCVELKGFQKILGFGKEYLFTHNSKINLPKLSKSSINEEGMKLLDFLGSASLGLDCKIPDNFKSNKESSGVYLKKYQGFIPPHMVKKIVDLVLKMKMESEWMCLSVNGFEDNVISWKNYEHGRGISGENDYKYVIFNDDHYWLFQILGQDDIYS